MTHNIIIPARAIYNKADHYVSFEGPLSDQNADGDEYPFWTVFVADDETGEPVSKVREIYDYVEAQKLAELIARKYGLDLVDEATVA